MIALIDSAMLNPRCFGSYVLEAASTCLLNNTDGLNIVSRFRDLAAIGAWTSIRRSGYSLGACSETSRTHARNQTETKIYFRLLILCSVRPSLSENARDQGRKPPFLLRTLRESLISISFRSDSTIYDKSVKTVKIVTTCFCSSFIVGSHGVTSWYAQDLQTQQG